MEPEQNVLLKIYEILFCQICMNENIRDLKQKYNKKMTCYLSRINVMKLLNTRETLRYTHESRVILLLVFIKLHTIALCRATSTCLVFIFGFSQSRGKEDMKKVPPM